MSKNTEISPDEAVAAELVTLLPCLPRVKITPQTISQTIIDRWYGYETEYRQTVAELRAELAELHAADNENIGTETRPLTKRELRDIGMAVVGPLKYVPERWDHETVVKLYWALMQQRGEAIMARRELAELHGRIGEESAQWGVRIYDDDPDEAIEPISSQQQARQLAVAWQDEIEGSNPTVVSRTRHVGKWKAADDA